MKINPIKYSAITFKQSQVTSNPIEPRKPNEDAFGYDDDISQQKRDLMREHIIATYMPDYKYHSEGRKSEYEMEKLLAKLNSKSKVDSEIINNLNIHNLIEIRENGYRGETLSWKKSCLLGLKDAGIERVIDLRGDEHYKDVCEEVGLEYKSFPMSREFWLEEAFVDEKKYLAREECIIRSQLPAEKIPQALVDSKTSYRVSSRGFVDDCIDLIETMNKGYFYIGCLCGTDRTDDALMLSEYFNPKNKQTTSGCFNTPRQFKKDCMAELYKKLTDEDKKRLEFTPEFEAKLRKKLEID